MCCCCGKEKRIINDYLGAINVNSRFLRESSGKNTILTQSSGTDGKKPEPTDVALKESRQEYNDRLDHYEKLYRCYIDSRRVKQTRWVIIAVAVVLVVTTICCAYGPNFRSQENTNTIATTTTSSNTVVVGGYADRDSYRYTYFQESNNGRR